MPDVLAEPLDAADEMSARPRPIPVAPYRKRDLVQREPAEGSTLVNMIQIATKSSPVITNDAEGHHPGTRSR